MVSAGGGRTELNIRTMSEMLRRYFFQNASTDNDNDASLSGYLHLFEPSSDTFVKHFISNTNTIHSTKYSQNSYVAGYGNTTSAIDAVDFKMSSGNIDAGTISLYGVV